MNRIFEKQSRTKSLMHRDRPDSNIDVLKKPRPTAAAAFTELLQIWANPKKLSIAGRDGQADVHPVCYYDADDGMKHRERPGASRNMPLGSIVLRTPGFGSMLRLPSKN